MDVYMNGFLASSNVMQWGSLCNIRVGGLYQAAGQVNYKGDNGAHIIVPGAPDA